MRTNWCLERPLGHCAAPSGTEKISPYHPSSNPSKKVDERMNLSRLCCDCEYASQVPPRGWQEQKQSGLSLCDDDLLVFRLQPSAVPGVTKSVPEEIEDWPHGHEDPLLLLILSKSASERAEDFFSLNSTIHVRMLSLTQQVGFSASSAKLL